MQGAREGHLDADGLFHVRNGSGARTSEVQTLYLFVSARYCLGII